MNPTVNASTSTSDDGIQSEEVESNTTPKKTQVKPEKVVSPITKSTDDLTDHLGKFQNTVLKAIRPGEQDIRKLHRLFYTAESAIGILQTTRYNENMKIRRR